MKSLLPIRKLDISKNAIRVIMKRLNLFLKKLSKHLIIFFKIKIIMVQVLF